LVLALGCGLAAAFMTQRLLADRNKVAEVEMVEVVVVKKAVAGQTIVKDTDVNDYFVLDKKPKDGVPSSAITDLRNVSNVRIARSLKEGDYVRADDVETREAMGLPGQIKPGMRSVAIRVNAEKLVGGLVLPGHKVDVVWTYRSANGTPGAKTILQDMEVLAVDTIRQKTSEGQTAIIGQTVTIAAQPTETMELLLAKENGEVSLVLRSVNDTAKLNLPEVKIDKVGSGSRNRGSESTEAPEGTEVASNSTTSVPPIRSTLPPVTPEKKPEAIKTVDPTTRPVVPQPTPVEGSKPVVEPARPVVVQTPPKFHVITFVKGDGDVVKWHYPKDEDSNNVDVKKSDLDESKKPESQLEGSADKK